MKNNSTVKMKITKQFEKKFVPKEKFTEER